jgi:hypothetical protein
MPAARRRLADPMPEAKPRADAYVGLLGLSLVAMIIGIAFLLLDYSSNSGTPSKPAPYKAPTPTAPPGP